jgi:hypothetical protein
MTTLTAGQLRSVPVVRIAVGVVLVALVAACPFFFSKTAIFRVV